MINTLSYMHTMKFSKTVKRNELKLWCCLIDKTSVSVSTTIQLVYRFIYPFISHEYIWFTCFSFCVDYHVVWYELRIETLLCLTLQCCKIRAGQVFGCQLFESQHSAWISSTISLASGHLQSSLSCVFKTSQDIFFYCWDSSVANEQVLQLYNFHSSYLFMSNVTSAS